MEPLNSLAARDVRSVIHPFTDLAHHVEEGPLVLARGDGVYVLDEQGALRHHVVVFVDGQLIRDRVTLADPVGEQSEIAVMQALSGG